MSDLVGNPEDQFSQNEAHMVWLKLACSATEATVVQTFSVASKKIAVIYLKLKKEAKPYGTLSK